MTSDNSTPASGGKIDVRVSGAIVHIDINNPAKRNAMTYQMWSDLGDELEMLAVDDACRVLVVRGVGDKAFCAGNDISEFEHWRVDPERTRRYAQTAHRATAALRDFPKPTLAAIRGFCIGGGFELALLCDIRVCDSGAQFAVTPARLGLGYDLNDTQLLVDRLGANAAREMLFTASRYGALDAVRLGIVTRAVEAQELTLAVSSFTDAIAANAPLSIQASKAIVAQAAKPVADQDVAACEALVDKCRESEDFAEGRAAFAQKRKPEFKGR